MTKMNTSKNAKDEMKKIICIDSHLDKILSNNELIPNPKSKLEKSDALAKLLFA